MDDTFASNRSSNLVCVISWSHSPHRLSCFTVFSIKLVKNTEGCKLYDSNRLLFLRRIVLKTRYFSWIYFELFFSIFLNHYFLVFYVKHKSHKILKFMLKKIKYSLPMGCMLFSRIQHIRVIFVQYAFIILWSYSCCVRSYLVLFLFLQFMSPELKMFSSHFSWDVTL